jgi:hypothetical protein
MDDGNKTERELPNETRQQIFAALAEIRFGAVEIVIHDGEIVQIERKEKIRFN